MTKILQVLNSNDAFNERSITTMFAAVAVDRIVGDIEQAQVHTVSLN